MNLFQFMLQLIAMLILSGVLSFAGILAVLRAWDWLVER